MTSSRPDLSPTPAAPALGLRWWLIFATVSAIGLALMAVVFGLLVNTETKIEMNPNGDPLVGQDAIGLWAFSWAAAAVFILLLAGAVFGWWRAFRRGRHRVALGLNLVVTVPAIVLVGLLTFATISELAAEAAR